MPALVVASGIKAEEFFLIIISQDDTKIEKWILK
jgi:hypothetical protein